MTLPAAIGLALLGLALGLGLGWLGARRRYRRRLDIESRALETALREARTDALTGIANRKAFDEHLELLSAIARRYDSALALALFDFDGLKQLNDRHGHAAGDAALVRFATVLRHLSRESDFVARVGGDEFAVLMPQTGREGAAALVRRISQALAEGADPAPLRASAGIAELAAGQPPAQLLEHADRALYAAKHATTAQLAARGVSPTD
jgi:diguanylate cyclase (GGDEF)-like protein